MVAHHTVHAFAACVKRIDAEVVLHDQVNNQRRADADGKAREGNEAKYFMPPEVAESNGKIVFEHKLSFEKVLILTFDFFVLLRSQTFHRVCNRCFYRLETYR